MEMEEVLLQFFFLWQYTAYFSQRHFHISYDAPLLNDQIYCLGRFRQSAQSLPLLQSTTGKADSDHYPVTLQSAEAGIDNTLKYGDTSFGSKGDHSAPEDFLIYNMYLNSICHC